MTWEQDAERIKYENHLINHRLTWLGVFEGVLFVAYYNWPYPSWLMPVAGIVIALSIGWGIHEANRQLAQLGEQPRLPFLMPDVVIPTVVVFAWVVMWAREVWWVQVPRGY